MQKEINKIIENILQEEVLPISQQKAIFSLSQKLVENDYSEQLIHSFLELGHFSQVNKSFSQSKLCCAWLDNLFKLIIKSRYLTGIMLNQRANRYPNNILFQLINGNNLTQITYQKAWETVKSIGLSIANITEGGKPLIGLYTPNYLETALVDLACLSFNFKIVPIPANASKTQLKYIISHSGITHLFVGGEEQINLISNIQSDIQDITLISLPKVTSTNFESLSWTNFKNYATNKDISQLEDRIASTDMSSAATIMYTSGTTDNPKGIIFTQTNIITKRFARALALPDVSCKDSFLCYLPLYHTFGRYLEMMGSIFWGATYTFAESPSFKSLLKNMKVAKPSIFISIPKRWFQLYELFISDISKDIRESNSIETLIADTTGGNLRLGLSAAGYLDPDIFTFFHKNNIQLLSGYGMTEATGGITMTPQNKYLNDSVGIPLPGIDLKLGEENELLIRGVYVTTHYHGTPKKSSLKNGWFHTGDIFTKKRNHYFIIDRKKEIYKNSRGITISPQKIENMFQDFDAVKSVFLVGDGKPYNTVLIYPDQSWIKTVDSDNAFSINAYFSSLLQSVNSFLAPYERIVNFAILDRNFSAAKDELTPKKTYKRKIIFENFDNYIAPMYEKSYHSFLNKTDELRIPKWLLRKAGILANELSWDGNYLKKKSTNKTLSLQFTENTIQIGNYTYANTFDYIDINKFILSPELWLGNQEFVDFFGFSSISPKHFEHPKEITLESDLFMNQSTKIDIVIINDIKSAIQNKIYDLRCVHKAAIILFNEHDYNLSIAINYLSRVLNSDKHELVELAIILLTRLRQHPSFKTRVKALEVLTPYINGELFIEFLSEIYTNSEDPNLILDIALDIRVIKQIHFRQILNKLGHLRNNYDSIDTREITLINALLSTITEYGIAHPQEFRWARSELTKWSISAVSQAIQDTTNVALTKLVDGFRNWLGPTYSIAIDQDSGEEYTWQDVIVFDPNVKENYNEPLFNAISKTQLLKEAIFLLSNYQSVHLDNIQKRGVWVMFLGSYDGKSAFRVTTQTRDHKNHNFVINLNENISDEFVINEIKLLITAGASSRGRKLVVDFGGYWPEFNIFTEEYVQGETLYQYFERNQNQISAQKNNDIWQFRWLHFVWNGAMAYFSFYRRTNLKYSIANLSLNNLIIPEHDYTVGTRLISISSRVPVKLISTMLKSLYKDFIIETEKRYVGLKHVADWEVIFCALLQKLSVQKGINLLEILIKELDDQNIEEDFKQYQLSTERIRNFISDINENGLLTKPLVFASLRYERWLNINPDATLEARGTMIQQLYTDYALSNLIADYPETRIRFFLMTALKDSNKNIRKELLSLQKGLRAKTISAINLDEYINNINKKFKLSSDDEYFLTRLIFEHVDAENKGKEFIWDAGSVGKLDLITLITDNFGENHQIRQPIHPKEIAKFQTLLLNSNLDAVFNQEHEFLLLINSANQLIGGIFWKQNEGNVAYLERIVIQHKYRKRHLSSGLLDEFFNRLKNKRYTHVTVGFFQAGLFYNKGFHTDKRFGGLVKNLS